MVARPPPSPQSLRILDLARRDRTAAAAALGALPPDAQAVLVCETPVARRAQLLDLLPRPEEVVPLVPEAELCFSIKAIGVTDAAWILEHATPEQLVTCVDLDGWRGDAPAVDVLSDWFAALSDTEDAALLRGLRALDPELLVLYLKSQVWCVQRPTDAEGWEPPGAGQTLDGQFFFVPRAENDLSSLMRVLGLLFEQDYWTYFRTAQGIIHELDTENEEWALRWRTGRLEDHGFPPREDAMRIYAWIRPGELAVVPEGVDPLDVEAWQLPVWVPDLPALVEGQPRVFAALSALDEPERRAAFYTFVALANRVAVADGLELSDAESTPRAIAKAAELTSRGLAHLAHEHALEDVEVVRRVSLERLFRVGANLGAEESG